ncbi:MAG: hypothetical protein GY822_10030 [Deltaproteobacteria bacterium]|nr:hypothetical protein [Deltaproteobacteria bacterium]
MRASEKKIPMAGVMLGLMGMLACESTPTVSTITVEGENTLKLFTVEPVSLPKVHLRDNGEDIPGVKATFTSRNEAILRIEDGKLIAVKNGNSGFDISVEGSKVTEYIGVIVAVVDDLELLCRPRSCEISKGDHITMQAETRSQGKMVFAEPEWKSANEEIAESKGKGRFLGKKPGRVKAMARIGDVVTKRSIVVKAPPPDELVVHCKRPKLTFRAFRTKKAEFPERSCTVKKGKGSDLEIEVLAQGKVVPMRNVNISVGDSKYIRLDGNRMIGLKKGTEVVRISLDGLTVVLPVEVR